MARVGEAVMQGEVPARTPWSDELFAENDAAGGR